MTKYPELERLIGKTADDCKAPTRAWLAQHVRGDGRKRCVIVGKPSFWRRILRWITGI